MKTETGFLRRPEVDELGEPHIGQRGWLAVAVPGTGACVIVGSRGVSGGAVLDGVKHRYRLANFAAGRGRPNHIGSDFR